MTRPSRVAQRRGVQRRRDDLAGGAAGVEPGVAGDALLHDLAQGRGELARLLRADEPRQRLLDHLVGAEAEQLRDGVVGLEDLALQVRDEHRVRGVGDDDVRPERDRVPPGVPLPEGGAGGRGWKLEDINLLGVLASN